MVALGAETTSVALVVVDRMETGSFTGEIGRYHCFSPLISLLPKAGYPPLPPVQKTDVYSHQFNGQIVPVTSERTILNDLS